MTLTLENVAEMAGVSRSTVSRVVNDHPSVRPEVRERVWQIVRETGYQPHAAARSLVTRRTHIIGVIIPEAVSTLFTEPFFSLLLSGISDACNIHGYQLMLSLFGGPAKQGGPPRQEEMYRRVVRGEHLDGVLVASTRVDDPLIPWLLRDRVPFVMIGSHHDARMTYVDVDNVDGARMAVEHLIRLGHRRIATITGPLNMPAGQFRLNGYQQALAAHRLPEREQLVVEGDFTKESGAMAMQRLLAASPTAVFAASDMMAVGALQALRQAGLRVPQDVALVGFDDIPMAATVEPALTTVRQPISRMGSMATEVLMGMFESSASAGAPAHKVILPTQLVVRDSCGALNGHGTCTPSRDLEDNR